LLDLTLEEIETDYWAHHFYDHPPAASDEDESWNLEEVLDKIESGDGWETVIHDR